MFLPLGNSLSGRLFCLLVTYSFFFFYWLIGWLASLVSQLITWFVLFLVYLVICIKCTRDCRRFSYVALHRNNCVLRQNLIRLLAIHSAKDWLQPSDISDTPLMTVSWDGDKAASSLFTNIYSRTRLSFRSYIQKIETETDTSYLRTAKLH